MNSISASNFDAIGISVGSSFGLSEHQRNGNITRPHNIIYIAIFTLNELYLRVAEGDPPNLIKNAKLGYYNFNMTGSP